MRFVTRIARLCVAAAAAAAGDEWQEPLLGLRKESESLPMYVCSDDTVSV